jgi:hypothetical protein
MMSPPPNGGEKASPVDGCDRGGFVVVLGSIVILHPYSPNRAKCSRRRKLMLWTIVVVLLILWLLGAFGGRILPRLPKTGNWIHTLLVIVIILVVLNLLGVI